MDRARVHVLSMKAIRLMLALWCYNCLAAAAASVPSLSVSNTCLLQSSQKRRQPQTSKPIPETLLWNGTALAELRELILASEVPGWAKKPLKSLTKSADKLLELPADLRPGVPEGPWSPTQKKVTAPDGDPQSFYCFKTYGWPCTYSCEMALAANPKLKKSCDHWEDKETECNATTGLPYKTHDGFQNPDAGLDYDALVVMMDSLEKLTLAWWYTNETVYASKAMLIFETWFIDNSTRMNPHMKYSREWPGREESMPSLNPASYRWNARLNDCVALLKLQEAQWTREVAEEWEAWSTEWFKWWTTSDEAKNTAGSHSNHGTWYYVHTLAMAFSLGDRETCVNVTQGLWETLACSRVEQIAPDGEQPIESGRVAGASYSLMNLDGLISQSIIAQRLCSKFDCGKPLLWDEETAGEPVASWTTTQGSKAKCKDLGELKTKPTLEECKSMCSSGEFDRQACNAINVKNYKNSIKCKFQDCRGEDYEVLSDGKFDLHILSRSEPGRGSVKKAFDYLARFADGADWVEEHPSSSDADEKTWKDLGVLARMLSTSFKDASGYEAKVLKYDDKFHKDWLNLVFPPPEFIYGSA